MSNRRNRISWWDLCEQVEQRLRDEPQNYCQGRYVVEKAYRRAMGLPTEGRNCGTAYCIEGWMGAICRVPHVEVGRALSGVVGLDAKYNLTAGGALFNYFNGTRGPVGTREYAEAGIKHLRKFMLANEDKLRTNLVPNFNG